MIIKELIELSYNSPEEVLIYKGDCKQENLLVKDKIGKLGQYWNYEVKGFWIDYVNVFWFGDYRMIEKMVIIIK